jgi:hypothetical protein
MPARDKIHWAVKAALIKDGWTITDDPYTLEMKPDTILIDMAAERFLALERGTEKIAVEVKTFGGRSDLSDFYGALGQYSIYSLVMRELDPDRTLYLAVPDVIFNRVFTRTMFQLALDRYAIKVIVVDIVGEEVVQWIT